MDQRYRITDKGVQEEGFCKEIKITETDVKEIVEGFSYDDLLSLVCVRYQPSKLNEGKLFINIFYKIPNPDEIPLMNDKISTLSSNLSDISMKIVNGSPLKKLHISSSEKIIFGEIPTLGPESGGMGTHKKSPSPIPHYIHFQIHVSTPITPKIPLTPIETNFLPVFPLF